MDNLPTAGSLDLNWAAAAMMCSSPNRTAKMLITMRIVIPLYNFFMCWAVNFSIRRLVPTPSKAISSRVSPPTFWVDSTMPRPKALCSSMSPFW